MSKLEPYELDSDMIWIKFHEESADTGSREILQLSLQSCVVLPLIFGWVVSLSL